MNSDIADRLDFRLLHIGVAVPDLAPAQEVLSSIFGYQRVSGPFEDLTQRVFVSFLAKSADDPAEIELVAPAHQDSPVRNLLDNSRGGAYHLCFETADLDLALKHARDRGCVIVSPPAPAVAFGGRRIAWVYARTRQLFEFVEAPKS